MKKITFSSIVLSLCLVTLLSGCFPSINSSQATSSAPASGSSEAQSVPSHVSKELNDDIVVDADVQYVNGKYSIYQSTYKQFTEDSLVPICLTNESVKTRGTVEDALYGDDISIMTDKKSVLYIARDYFNFQKSEYGDYSTFITGANENDYFLENMNEVYPHKKLSSLDEAGAEQKVKDVIQKLNLPVDENSLQIYSLTAESLNKQAAQFMTDEEYQADLNARGKTLKHNFTSVDEAYLFVYHCHINGLPLHFDDYSAPSRNGVAVKGARVHALVNKNGLVMFQVHGIPDVQSVIKENIAIIPIDTALNAIKDKYKNTILTDKMKITDISLDYFPCNENKEKHSFSLTPVWAFSTELKTVTYDAKGKQETLKKNSILVNAVTGQEIR